MQTIILGGDFGNSETSVAYRKGRGVQHLTFPSYLGSGNYAELIRVRRGAGGTGDLEEDEFALSHRGANLFVGRLALEQARDATTGRGNAARYSNGHTLRLLLTACAKLFREDVTIRLITGLPVGLFSEEEKARVRASLCGTHTVVFNGRERTIVVEAVGVMMEGAAVLHDVALEAVNQCVIDIGGGSTDLFWANGRKPRYERCVGYGEGVEKIGEHLRASVQAISGVGRRLSDDELRRVLRAYAERQSLPPLHTRGKPLTINGELEAAVRAVGEELSTFVGRAWADADGVASSAAYARLIGGGAYYLKPILKGAIPHLSVPEHPERANAVAYLAIGEAASEEAWARNRG
jgi:hypothetical protein